MPSATKHVPLINRKHFYNNPLIIKWILEDGIPDNRKKRWIVSFLFNLMANALEHHINEVTLPPSDHKNLRK